MTTKKEGLSDIEIVAHVQAWSTAPKGMPLNHRLYYHNQQKGWMYLRGVGKEVYETHRSEIDMLIQTIHNPAIESWAKNAVEETLGSKIEAIKDNKKSYDRHEFCNAVIGWLGNDEVYQKILRCSLDELNRLIRDPSEELEDQIKEYLSMMSVEELNKLAKDFNMNCEIYKLDGDIIRKSYYIHQISGDISVVEVLKEDYYYQIRHFNSNEVLEVPHIHVTYVRENAELISEGIKRMYPASSGNLNVSDDIVSSVDVSSSS
jgi:hypothetical protein